MRAAGAAVQSALKRCMKLLFVAIAGPAIGYGHLSRCLALADCARRQGIAPAFLVFGDDAALRRVERAGYRGRAEPLSALASGLGGCKIADCDAVVVDFSHPVVFDPIDGVLQLLQTLRAHARVMMVIDALGEQALAWRMPDMPADVLALPYVGAAPESGRPWRTLAGPEYAVLAPAYADLPPRAMREHADRVLVSCGGSDPKGLTPIVLDGIERISGRLFVRVVVGPLFSAGQIDALTVHAKRSRHAIELLHSPDGLAQHMIWSDLTVAASGLIKYELAATSTPAVLISMDANHDIVNRPFACAGSVRDLGVEFDAQLLAKTVSDLLQDAAARLAMAEAGRHLVDGNGANRLLAELTKVAGFENMSSPSTAE